MKPRTIEATNDYNGEYECVKFLTVDDCDDVQEYIQYLWDMYYRNIKLYAQYNKHLDIYLADIRFTKNREWHKMMTIKESIKAHYLLYRVDKIVADEKACKNLQQMLINASQTQR